MNAPIIKILIYKNDVNEKPIEKIGSVTKAHLDGMQDAINQNKNVTEYMKNINEQWFKNIGVIVPSVGDILIKFNK